MGYRKVYIDKKVIIEQYKYNGYNGLRNLFLKSDAIIYMSDKQFCEEIVKILFFGEKEDNKIRLKISKLLI